MTITESRRDHLESLYQDMSIKELRTLAAERTPNVKSRSKQAYAEALLAWHIAQEEKIPVVEEVTPEPIEDDEELTPEDMADLEEIMSEPVMGPYTTEELTQLLTQPEKPAVGTLVRLKGSLVGRQYRITRYYEDNYHFVCEMVNEPENTDRTRVWNLDDVEVVPPEPASEQLAVQANLIAFFEAAYQYCYTQVSDYLPQPHEYIYGSHYRPINAVWARIPEAHYIQLDHKSNNWVYSWVVVPEPLDAKTLASYELELVRVPEAVLQAWKELLAVPSYCERKLADDRTMDELKYEIDIMRAEIAAKTACA